MTKHRNMETITINNRKYNVLEVTPASQLPALAAEHPTVLEFLIIEGSRGGLHYAIRKAEGIFLS